MVALFSVRKKIKSHTVIPFLSALFGFSFTFFSLVCSSSLLSFLHLMILALSQSCKLKWPAANISSWPCMWGNKGEGCLTLFLPVGSGWELIYLLWEGCDLLFNEWMAMAGSLPLRCHRLLWAIPLTSVNDKGGKGERAWDRGCVSHWKWPVIKVPKLLSV